MELTHDFTVAVPVEHAWQVLLDVERIAPCMPGATLTSYEGDEFTGTVRVKLGPVLMTFAGQGRFVERDADARRMVIEAAGKDRKGGGTARATIRANLHDRGDTTGVEVHSDLVVTGRAAQFGRGMIADVSNRLLGQFTDCLEGKLAAPAGPTTATGPAVAPGEPAQTEAPPGRAGGEVRQPEPQGGAAPGSQAGEAEPIDLLAVTGIRAAAARVVPYVIIFVVGALVGAGLVVLLG